MRADRRRDSLSTLGAPKNQAVKLHTCCKVRRFHRAQQTAIRNVKTRETTSSDRFPPPSPSHPIIRFVRSADRFSTLRRTTEINDFYVFNEIVNYTRHPYGRLKSRLRNERKTRKKNRGKSREKRRNVIIEFTGASREPRERFSGSNTEVKRRKMRKLPRARTFARSPNGTESMRDPCSLDHE